jgi:tRNA(fMet)-specific endonuclease VapC
MKYILDTDICSYIIKQRSTSLLNKLNQIPMEDLGISVVTYAELMYGVKRSSSKQVNEQIIEGFIRHLTVHDWTKDAALHYADIRSVLESTGDIIGNLDMMIGAHARSIGATIVTNNTKHFSKILELDIENWADE